MCRVVSSDQTQVSDQPRGPRFNRSLLLDKLARNTLLEQFVEDESALTSALYVRDDGREFVIACREHERGWLARPGINRLASAWYDPLELARRLVNRDCFASKYFPRLLIRGLIGSRANISR